MSADPYSRMYLWLVRHRGAVLVATGLLMAVCAAVSSRLRLEEDLLALFPERDPIVRDYEYALKKFRQIDRLYLDVGAATNDPAALAPAADALYAALSTNASYADVQYRVDLVDQQKIVQFVTGALPTLFTAADAAALEEKLAPARVRDYLAAMRRKLAGPEGLVLKDVVAADPIGMSGLVAAKLLPLQVGFGNARLEDGRITSADGRHVLLMAEPKFPSSNSGDSRRLVTELMASVAAVERGHPGIDVAVTGGHRMAVDNATLIQGDVRRCAPLGLAAMGLLCLVALRRRWLAFVMFLPSLFGMLLAAVALTLWHWSLSSIAIGFATIAVGISVDYSIDVVYHLDNAIGLDRAAVGHHLGRLVLPVLSGALTTAAAFAVMALSPMRAYQQIGVFGAVGVLCSAAFVLVILPLLIPAPKREAAPAPLWLTRLLERFYAWRARRLPWLLAGVVLLTAASAAGLRRLRFEGDIGKLNGISENTRHDEETIRRTWDDALGLTLVVTRGATLEEALRKNDRVAGQLAGRPGVDAVYSLSAVCPAQATQAENLRRWRAFWTDARRAALRETLRQAGAELGFRAGAFGRFWACIEGEPAPVTPDTFRDTPLEKVFRERLALGGGEPAVSTMLKLADRAEAPRLRAELPDAMVLDKKMFAEHVAGLARGGLGRFALWTALLVAAIIYGCLSSAALTAATLLPVAFGLLWTLGTMGWLGVPIDMMNCIFVVFIVGIGEDYSTFLVMSRLDEWRGHPQRLAVTSAAMLVSALGTLFGFAVLVLARHPVLFSLGTTALLGMTCSFAASLVLTLLCTDWVLRRAAPLPADGARAPAATRRGIARLYRYQGPWVEHFVYWKLRTDPMFPLLDGAVPRQGLLLDLGCGYGVAAHWLALHSPGRRLIGVDYDAGKIRVARCTTAADDGGRVRFEAQDLLAWPYPACDAVLLLDVLHYWTPDKQAAVLARARAALPAGGRLVLRDAARAGTDAHRRIDRAERAATRLGFHQTVEGLHFLTLAEMKAMLARAGFEGIEVRAGGGLGSNVLIVASASKVESDAGHQCVPVGQV